jgi:hypothetical protein
MTTMLFYCKLPDLSILTRLIYRIVASDMSSNVLVVGGVESKVV